LAALLLWSGYNPSEEPPTPGEDQDQLQALRQQFADLLHQRELGLDPATNSWRADEARAGLQLESEMGVRLSRSLQPGEDWVDQYGRTYDAIGTNLTSEHFNYSDFTNSLSNKLTNNPSVRVVVDLSRLDAADADSLQPYLAKLANPRVIVLNYGQ